jgi:hypothetical protein
MGKLGITKMTPATERDLGKIRSSLIFYRQTILNGTFVAIDPSCISRNGSRPGYAVYQKGICVEQGVLDVKFHISLAYRLQALRKLIADSIAPHVDMLIIEATPVRPIRSKAGAASSGKTYMNFTSIASLKQACGAIKAAFPVGTPVVEITALLWQNIARAQGIEITKEDSEDARLIGHAAVSLVQTSTT